MTNTYVSINEDLLKLDRKLQSKLQKLKNLTWLNIRRNRPVSLVA